MNNFIKFFKETMLSKEKSILTKVSVLFGISSAIAIPSYFLYSIGKLCYYMVTHENNFTLIFAVTFILGFLSFMGLLFAYIDWASEKEVIENVTDSRGPG